MWFMLSVLHRVIMKLSMQNYFGTDKRAILKPRQKDGARIPKKGYCSAL